MTTHITPVPPAMPGISLGLARITTLVKALQSPHLALPIVHIAGTNGKGSVGAYISSILTVAGLRVGRFNSPHLVDEWDCIEIGGETISKSIYDQAKLHVHQVDGSNKIGATSFELLTATAFEVFRREHEKQKIDLAIIEVGMGGLTDATNIVPASSTLLSVITPIELDHQKFLGDTIEEIATVKAGIVKQGVEVVLAQQTDVVEKAVAGLIIPLECDLFCAQEAAIVGSQQATTGLSPSRVLIPLTARKIYSHSRLATAVQETNSAEHESVLTPLPLPGSYQRINAAAAVLAVQVLRKSSRTTSMEPKLNLVDVKHIQLGVGTTKWPGRLDWIDVPLSDSTHRKVLLDGAHNPSSAIHLASYLSSLPTNLTPKTLILAMSAPRPPLTILRPLLERSRITRIVCTEFTRPEGMEWIFPTPAEDIEMIARELSGEGESRIERELVVVTSPSVEDALLGMAETDTVVIAGSLYLVADVYRLVRRSR